MATTTPNMSLTIPVTGDAATSYVASLASSLTALDTHDHTPGKGVPLKAAALSWLSTVDVNAQAIQNIFATRYVAQAAALSPASYPRALYANSNGDLFWNTNSVSLQLTANGAFNGTLLGGFGGTYVSQGAQATYQTASGYTFNTPSLAVANINAAYAQLTGATLSSGTLYLGGATASTAVLLSPAVTKTYRVNPMRGFTFTATQPTVSGFGRITVIAGTSLRWLVPLPVPNFGNISAVRMRFYVTSGANPYTGTVGVYYGSGTDGTNAPVASNTGNITAGQVGNFVMSYAVSPTLACAGNHFYIDFNLSSPTNGGSLSLVGIEFDVLASQLPDTLG